MPNAAEMQKTDLYLQKLKGAGLRITEQRRALLSLLLAAEKPMTVHEAYEAINKGKKKKVADLASVYRIFEAFEELELVHQANHNSYILCQHLSCASKYHVLLHCNSCNGFVEMHMPSESMDSFASYFRKSKKFQIDKHPLSLSGLCSDCR